jgi:hypothetical protein
MIALPELSGHWRITMGVGEALKRIAVLSVACLFVLA